MVRRIEALGRRTVALRLDVADSASFTPFAERLQRTLASVWQRERFDHLVNNAGVTSGKFRQQDSNQVFH